MKPTNEEVIADIAKSNLNLKRKSKGRKKALKAIERMLVCMGGPLNDNIMHYSPEQLRIFSDILDTIEGAP